MHRRTLLMTGGAALAAACASQGGAGKTPSVAIIGGGIMGCSLAFHLAKAGARVTVLERTAIGAGATQGAFALLIASHHDHDKRLFDLYISAVREWRSLEDDLQGEVPIQWGGDISWVAPGADADALKQRIALLQSWGSDIREITPDDLRALVPGVEPGAFGAGAFAPSSGTLDPLNAVQTIARHAQTHGAEILHPCDVNSFIVSDGAVTALETSLGRVEADIVVVAAGAQTSPLLEKAKVRTEIDIVSGALAHSKPQPRMLERVVTSPLGSLKQNPDGRIVTGPDYAPGAHAEDTSVAYGNQLLSKVSAILPNASTPELDFMTLGHVPIPADGVPIAGRCPGYSNLYACLTMSGVTLAPLIARLLSTEIMAGSAAPELDGYGPARFEAA